MMDLDTWLLGPGELTVTQLGGSHFVTLANPSLVWHSVYVMSMVSMSFENRPITASSDQGSISALKTAILDVGSRNLLRPGWRRIHPSTSARSIGYRSCGLSWELLARRLVGRWMPSSRSLEGADASLKNP